MQLQKTSEVFWAIFFYHVTRKGTNAFWICHFQKQLTNFNFSIRYKTWVLEKKRNQILIQISLWSGCLQRSSLSAWGSQFLLVHQSLCLRLMIVMAVSLIVHHISVILIYGFHNKSKSLWKNGCPWVIYILSAYTL